MTDLVEFLRARLNEDEAVARAAIGEPFTSTGIEVQPFPAGTHVVPDGRWSARSEHEADNRYIEGLDILIYDEGGHDEHQAAHIAHWDPARVLAEVVAKRARLAFLAETAARCPEDDWPAEGGMEWAPLSDMARYLLRMEAQPYADHVDFTPAWQV